MQIILEETEIMEALDNYCAKNILVPADKKLKVTFTVGRGDNGTKATLEFEDKEIPETSVEKPTPIPAEKKVTKKDEKTLEKELPVEPAEEKSDEGPTEKAPVEKEPEEASAEPVTDGDAGPTKGKKLFDY